MLQDRCLLVRANPWIFRHINAYLEQGKKEDDPDYKEIVEMICVMLAWKKSFWGIYGTFANEKTCSLVYRRASPFCFS